MDRLSYRAWIWLLPLLTKQNWYDRGIFWRKQLLRKASELIRQHGIRNVVVTGAPFSLMAFAAELKTPFPEINLIADFRDIWTWGTDYGMRSMASRRLRQEKQLEAFVIKNSDHIISPSSLILDHLYTTYSGDPERYVTIPHAVDPDDLDLDASPPLDGVFRMIYAGSLYGADEAQHYFSSLLDAFEALRRDKPSAYANCRLDLYITASDTTAYEHMVKVRDLQDRIHFHAPLPPKEALKRTALSDLVLNFFPYNKKDILGTKFHEIFHLHRPVLHVGEPGLVSRTLTERRLGDSLCVEELATELPRIISGERKIEIDRNADHSELLLANVTDLLMQKVFI